MGKFVFDSIIFLGSILFLIYIYMIFRKLIQFRITKQKARYIEDLSDFMDEIIRSEVDEIDCSGKRSDFIRNSLKKPLIREVFEEKLSGLMENAAGETLQSCITLCENLELVDYHINELKSSNKFVLAYACKKLGDFKSKRAIGPILKMLGNNSSDVIYNALMALAKIGDMQAFITGFKSIGDCTSISERSLIEIVDSFEGDKYPIYKSVISLENEHLSVIFIKSAGNNRDNRLSEDIARYLFDESKEMRIAAVKALGIIGEAAYLEDIVKLLKDSEWEVRAVSASALKNMKDGRALIPLVSALSDPQWHVRYNAADSILGIPGGLEAALRVFEGEDEFAKDMVISAIEKNGSIDAVNAFERDRNRDYKEYNKESERICCGVNEYL